MIRLFRRFISWLYFAKADKMSEKWLEKNTNYWWHRR